jgi:hypothetical protein
MSNNKFSLSRDCFSLAQLKSRSAIANRLSIKSFYFAAMPDDLRAFTTALGLFLLLIYFPLDVLSPTESSKLSEASFFKSFAGPPPVNKISFLSSATDFRNSFFFCCNNFCLTIHYFCGMNLVNVH